LKESYNRAMNKITAKDGFEDHLKARLIREQARIDESKPAPASKKHYKMMLLASTAAVLVLTVVLSHFSILNLKNRTSNYETEYTETVPASNGYTVFAVAEDLSFRLTSTENCLNYDSDIYFTFEGFDEYGIDLRESCIVFNTALDEKYTLADFFFDYYNIITQQTGYTTIDNGVLDSFFGIKDNSNQTLSVYDELRGEIVDLESVLMEEYWDMDEVWFTIKVSEL